MKSCAWAAATLTLIGGIGLLGRWSQASDAQAGGAKGKKQPTIGELMARSHKGDNSPLMKLDRELRAAEVAWMNARQYADALVTMKKAMEAKGAILRYRDGRGYIDSVAALDAAIEKKDKAAATTALQRVKSSCARCHYGNNFD